MNGYNLKNAIERYHLENNIVLDCSEIWFDIASYESDDDENAYISISLCISEEDGGIKEILSIFGEYIEDKMIPVSQIRGSLHMYAKKMIDKYKKIENKLGNFADFWLEDDDV